MEANLGNSQVMCWHCEEVVHRYASVCPYCRKSLSHIATDTVRQTSADYLPDPQEVHGGSKITAIPSLHLQVSAGEEVKKEVKEEESRPLPEVMQLLIPLVSLLSGAFLFFFGVFLKLFAKDGTLVLMWDATAWPYYLFPALTLVALGMSTLSRVRD